MQQLDKHFIVNHNKMNKQLAACLRYLNHSTGGVVIRAPKKTWNSLIKKPYQNQLFQVQVSNNGNVMVNYDLRDTLTVRMATLMLKDKPKETCQLEEDSGWLSLDFRKSLLPCRWAGMLGHFYFAPNKLPYQITVDENVKLDDNFKRNNKSINVVKAMYDQLPNAVLYSDANLDKVAQFGYHCSHGFKKPEPGSHIYEWIRLHDALFPKKKKRSAKLGSSRVYLTSDYVSFEELVLLQECFKLVGVDTEMEVLG